MIVYEECLVKEIQYMIIRKLMDGDVCASYMATVLECLLYQTRVILKMVDGIQYKMWNR